MTTQDSDSHSFDAVNKAPFEKTVEEITTAQPHIYPLYMEAVAEQNEDKVKYLLKDTVYLTITDHGGQTEFLDLMSRFLMGASLHLIFSRLTDSWDRVFKIYCTNEEGVSTNKEDSIVTLEEATFQTLASIACMKDTSDMLASKHISNPNLSKPKTVTKAMFVGTFRDKVSLSQFKIRDQILIKKIEQTEFYHKRIVEYASAEFLTLALDNKKGTVEEINKASETFENCIKNNLGEVHIPCSWLMFSIVLRSKEKSVMTLKECNEIAEKLKISLSDVPNVLWFLHYHVGMLLYYPEVKGFEDIIICDVRVRNNFVNCISLHSQSVLNIISLLKHVVQVIFDFTTQLVKKIFSHNKVGRQVYDKFKETAQFTMTDLLEATKDTNDLITMEMLITLFEHHNILAPLPVTESRKNTTYFMPSILKSATKDELQNVPISADVGPLMYRYKCGYLPLGVFSSLIIGLVSNTKLNWTFKEDNPCRNKIEFLVGKDKDTVTIISYATYIEVVFYRESHQETPTSVVCAHIRNTIISMLTQVNHNLKYDNAIIQYGFECTDHPPDKQSFWDSVFKRSNTAPLHLCILEDEDSHKMKCLKDRKETKIIPLIDPKQTVWFDEVCH